MTSGELDAVLDEEDRDVVAHQVERALGRVELRCEATGVADGVRGSARAEHGREPDEHRCGHALGEERRPADPLGVAVPHEHAVGAGPARVHDPLGDALVVEVRDLLAEMMVLQQRRPALPRLQRVVGVAQAQTLGRRQEGTLLGHVGRGGVGLCAGRRTSVGAGLVGLGWQWALRLGGLREAGRLRGRGTGDERCVVPAGQGLERLLGGGGHGLLGGLDDGGGDAAGSGHARPYPGSGNRAGGSNGETAPAR